MAYMSKIQQSVAWWCFVPAKLSPEAFIRAVAEAGYAAIELAPREHWQLIKDHGLKLSGIGGHGSIIDGLNDRAQHTRIEKELRANIAEAAQWSIPSLICFSGSRRELSEAEGAEITAEGFRRVSKVAEDAGVTLALELLNSKVDHADYQCDRTDWGVKVCERVNSPRVKLLYDIYHMQIMEGDLIRTIKQAAPWIAYYHTAGNPGRHELDEAQEIYYPPILRAIVETGFAGYIAHEYIPMGEPVQALHKTFVDCAPYLV